jgi:drug/metabolite transporter (DMT)-like permease
MNWILLAVVAQFFIALVALIDKRIVTDEKILPQPFVYAFYTCLISGGWIIVYTLSLLPLSFENSGIPMFSNINRPSLEIIALALLSAYTFFIALVSMFTALRASNAADVVPVVGATSAIASYALGHFFLGTAMTSNYALGIALLAVGTFLVSHFQFSIKTAFVAIHAGIFFALHYVSIKGLFLVTSFDDGFFWSRIAFMFFGLSLLMVPNYFKRIKKQTKATTKQAGILIFSNKILAGISTLLVLKATDLGDVAVVQALGGLQFVFILLLGLFFSVRAPALPIGEHYHPETILQKALFVAVIALGFLVLFR